MKTLPEKWHIEVNNLVESETYRKFFNSKIPYAYLWEFNIGFIYGYGGRSYTCGLKYTQITFEQFKKYVLKEDIEDKLVYYMDNGSIFPRFESIALQKPEILHFETIEDCKEFYSNKVKKVEKVKVKPISRRKRLRKINLNQKKVSNNILSFRNNTGTGACYIYIYNTDRYHSNISNAKISYSNCINRYPIFRVINTQKEEFIERGFIKQLGPRFKKEYRILKFRACKKSKKIYAICIPCEGNIKEFQFEIDKITHINN
jgi:hypothetical protein